MTQVLSILTIGLMALPSVAEVKDPQYLDGAIERLMYTLNMQGTLRIDNYAVANTATDWTISVEEIELPGRTNKTVEKAYAKLIRDTKRRFRKSIIENYIYDEDKSPYEELSLTELIDHMPDEGGMAFYFEGKDHHKIVGWFLDEILTYPARVALSDVFDRKQLQFYRHHGDSTAAEIVGEDLIIIRGVKKVIIIKIEYAHS